MVKTIKVYGFKIGLLLTSPSITQKQKYAVTIN
jgi:hypothetical protein